MNNWIKIWNELSDEEKNRILKRSEEDIEDVFSSVQTIIDNVRQNGDQALREYNHRFDKAPENMELRVTDAEMAQAEKTLSPKVKQAIDVAVKNVRTFHKNQIPEAEDWIEIAPGIRAKERTTPIESIGLYIPRGRGSFPSMLYMAAIPAQIAGVKRICLMTPPDAEGKADAACLYAARLCGVTEIYKVGGAHAIAALALGTESIRPVYKINGPGSKYVAAAKRLLSNLVDAGMPAGPTESLIIADNSADPRLLALDLLTEAEHGSDSCALVLTDSADLAKSVLAEIERRLEQVAEPRLTFLKDGFDYYGAVVVCRDIKTAAEIADRIATEHLQLAVREPEVLAETISNAAEILIGQGTPFSLANYAIGANAILPTGGKARTYSPLSVRDFLKYTSLVQTTEEGFTSLKDHVIALAEYEEFPCHAGAIKDR